MGRHIYSNHTQMQINNSCERISIDLQLTTNILHNLCGFIQPYESVKLCLKF